MTWREYETYIARHLQRAFPASTIRHDVKRDGVVSKTKRQIDILIEDRIAGIDISIVVDCKYFSKKINVTHIDSFIGFLADVQASKGVLITNEGYSKAAYNRATYDTRDVEIRIIDFEDLEKFQSFIAIPYMSKHAAIVSAPPGWVVDAAPNGKYLCSFYPAGLTQTEAFHGEGFIYLSMSKKDRKWPDLDHLLETQKSNMVQHYRLPRIEFIGTIKREDCEVRMRVVETKEVPNTLEYTIFMDFGEVIIFMTLLTPRDKEERYRKKLEWIAERLSECVLVLDPSGVPASISPRAR